MVIPAAADRALYPIVYNSSSIVYQSSEKSIGGSLLASTARWHSNCCTSPTLIPFSASRRPATRRIARAHQLLLPRPSLGREPRRAHHDRPHRRHGRIHQDLRRALSAVPLLRGFIPLDGRRDRRRQLTCMERRRHCAGSLSAPTEALTHAVNGFNFYDSCHSVCFPRTVVNASRLSRPSSSWSMTEPPPTKYPYRDARCEEYLLPTCSTLNDVAIVQSLTMTRQATDPSPPPPSLPPPSSPPPPSPPPPSLPPLPPPSPPSSPAGRRLDQEDYKDEE